jgi:restriction endonuclease Mrr
MSTAIADMVELDERDEEVLSVLAEGRANPYYIREQTGLGKGDTNTVLNRLARAGHVRQVTRGLYEITENGEQIVREDVKVD